MPVEIAVGLRLLGVRELTNRFRPTVTNTIGLRAQITLPALGLLARCPKIYNVRHTTPRW